MKIVLTLTCLLLAVSPALAERSKYTADYVRNFKSDQIDQKVTLEVAWMKPVKMKEEKDYTVVIAHTWDEREKNFGGTIPVVLLSEDRVDLLKKYDTAPDKEGGKFRGRDLDTRRLSGILREVGKGKTLVVDLTDGKVDLSELRKPEEDKDDGKGRKPEPKKPLKKGPGKKPGKK